MSEGNEIYTNSEELQMGKEYNPLKDRICQFDMYLTDVQAIWEQIDTNRNHHKKKNCRHFNKYEDFYDSMFFKMEELHSLVIDIEKSIHNLPFEYYLTYFGPYKEPDSRGKFFYDNTSRGKEAKRKIIFLFDAFLAQYKSLADLVIQNCWNIVKEKNPSLPDINSLGHCLKELRENKEIQDFPVVEDVKKYETEFSEINNYRDYIIHHGILPADDSAERTPHGHNITRLWIPEIVRTGRNTYDLYESCVKKGTSLSFFIRDRYKKLLEFIKECTNIDKLMNI
jgi:hypothetical protein